ncbi:MAG: hypothetical protein AB7V04_14525, partial [Desulfomonilaceae bacterium]
MKTHKSGPFPQKFRESICAEFLPSKSFSISEKGTFRLPAWNIMSFPVGSGNAGLDGHKIISDYEQRKNDPVLDLEFIFVGWFIFVPLYLFQAAHTPLQHHL